MTEINFQKLGDQLGLKVVDVQFPNNGPVAPMQVWTGEDIRAGVAKLNAMEREGQEFYLTGGAAPHLAAAVAYTLLPAKIIINVAAIEQDVEIPDLPIGTVNLEAGVGFKVEERDDKVFVELIELSNEDGKTPPPNLPGQNYLRDNINRLILPQIPEQRYVYIKGSAPNFISAPVVLKYAAISKSVSMRMGNQTVYTCAVSNCGERRVGDEETI